MGGGGVVAECVRRLQEPTRFSWGGGGSSIIFPWYPEARAICWEGSTMDVSFVWPFYIFRLSQRGGPGPPPQSATVHYRVQLYIHLEPRLQCIETENTIHLLCSKPEQIVLIS